MKNFLLLLALLLSGCTSFFNLLGGNFNRGPVHPLNELSLEAQELVEKAFNDVEHPFDHHVHLIGKDNGNYVNPAMQKWWNLPQYIKYRLYISAGGIEDLTLADEQYIQRLVSLISVIPNHGKFALYAMDRHYSENGQYDLEQTPFYISNENMMNVVKNYPGLFVPVISIHPYRTDALAELEKYAEQGVRFIKWLPNSMGIDPSHESTTAFYEMMLQYDMVLLTHTGEESAVHSEDAQHLGNPLLLRKPLDMGVKVVALHTATDGENKDLDNPGNYVSNLELMIRLLENPKYKDNLWGELAAVTVVNRMDSLETLLQRQDLHPRLLNGSDYPIPAINCVIWLGRLQNRGFITQQEKRLLQEIYYYNPLLFDFVLKRTLKHPETGEKFADSIFTTPFLKT